MAKGCTTNNTYEEARKQRLEENKKRFQDLGISRISKNLTEIASAAKKTPKTPPRLPKLKSNIDGVVEPRRSSRVRNPVTTYREDVNADLPSLRKRSRSRPSSWESYVARPLDEIKVATERERNRALDAAEAFQMNLQTSYPSFVKSMGLPSRFCEEHLPKTLYDMILEDEDGSEYEAVYIGKRSGLSGGWRAFALDHKLDDGDALVFELVEASRFKIYICRAFPESVEDEEDTLEEEGTTREAKATKVKKAASNAESKSNKSKKPKQAIVHETKESANQNTLKEEGRTRASKRLKAAGSSESEESNKVKKPKQAIMHETNESENSQDSLLESSIDNEVKPAKKTKSSQKEMKKKYTLPVTGESKGEAPIETMKPKEAVLYQQSELGDSGKAEQLLLENEVVKPNPCKKKELQDAENELKKVEPIEQASKRPRKQRAVKLFRKKV
ncbi:putative B3 domain-containing protein At5g58280 isoform X2 [Lotus japonicus]|uniref:putative B3 domain-containing protein At5g58280 isoform X2 n=1 Tax=Lotus japonicus TaxID=34305 RepID=UPI00258EE2BB|nr:putative B3 domain-containing protein At5g58280 isoform X2 [Lotus japonicus]